MGCFYEITMSYLLTLITKHKENGTVIIIRNIESAVRRNAVNPRPSESAVKKENNSEIIKLFTFNLYI